MGTNGRPGALTPASPLAPTVLIPTVTIGGLQATVLFSGLAPRNVGLYQVNVLVPKAASPSAERVDLDWWSYIESIQCARSMNSGNPMLKY